MRNKEFKFHADVNNDGAIRWKNAKTISTYKKLLGGIYSPNEPSEVDNILANPAFCFFAVSREDFNKGYEAMKPHLAEGEKVISVGACTYFSRKGLEMYKEAKKRVNNSIAELCDPQEVYCYEYNNHECMYDFDGDTEAIDIVIEHFGLDVAKTIKRYSVCKDI